MLENYFITQGREWERYAWIKARVVCGDRAQELADLVRPFVFRRHLDYTRSNHARPACGDPARSRAARHTRQRQLGPGGIREMNLSCNCFNWSAAVTMPAAPAAHARCAAAAGATSRRRRQCELTAAHVFLRNLEHRLQYLDDRRPRALATSDEDQTLIAAATGHADFAQLRRTRAARSRRSISKILATSAGRASARVLWDGAGIAPQKMLRELDLPTPRGRWSASPRSATAAAYVRCRRRATHRMRQPCRA
jgi:glutamate-ammonia-ligase adenylyltransferase